MSAPQPTPTADTIIATAVRALVARDPQSSDDLVEFAQAVMAVATYVDGRE